MKKRDNNINAILMNGDLVKHGGAIYDKNPTDEKLKDAWQKIKVTIRQVMKISRERFPNIPILPSIGNNDVI